MKNFVKKEMITPAELWKDFDVNRPTELLYKAEKGEIFSSKEYELMFVAEEREDGRVEVAARLYVPDNSDGIVVLVEDCNGVNHTRELENLLKLHFAILVVDYSAMHRWGTRFPASVNYCEFEKRGDRLNRIDTLPKESCQFEYAKIISAAIGCAKHLSGGGKVLVVAVAGAAEFAIQAIAMDKRADGLLLVGGNCYTEYNDIDQFDNSAMPEMSEELMVWMTAVAAIAYVKYIECPLYITSGSNSLICDMDKLEAFTATMEEGKLCLLQKAGERDTLDADAFGSMNSWLGGILRDEVLPTLPKVEIKPYKQGDVCVEVFADTSLIIEDVQLHYSFSEINRRYRYWKTIPCNRISMGGEYIAGFANEYDESPLFVYATVNYVGGISVSSFIRYTELPKAEEEYSPQNIVLNNLDSFKEFAIDRNAHILVDEEKCIVKTGLGLTGVTSKSGGLRTFAVNDRKINKKCGILQIDFFSEKKKTVHLEVERYDGQKSVKYSTNVVILGSSMMFTPTRLTPTDFKDKELIPLDNWQNIRSLSVITPGVAVGNIIFV